MTRASCHLQYLCTISVFIVNDVAFANMSNVAAFLKVWENIEMDCACCDECICTATWTLRAAAVCRFLQHRASSDVAVEPRDSVGQLAAASDGAGVFLVFYRRRPPVQHKGNITTFRKQCWSIHYFTQYSLTMLLILRVSVPCCTGQLQHLQYTMASRTVIIDG